MKNIKTFRMLIMWALLSCSHSLSLSAADVAGKIETSGFTNYVQKIPGSTVTFEMVSIPGGTITIGSNPDESGREATDSVRKRITVKPFWMGKYEVSWNEYVMYVHIDYRQVAWNRRDRGGIVDFDGVTHPSEGLVPLHRERGELMFPLPSKRINL